MPSERFLKTNMGGYAVVDLDGATLAAHFKEGQDISAQLAGPYTATQFSTPSAVAYIAGTLKAFLRGQRQKVTEDDPANGLFSLVAPPQAVDVPFVISFMV